MLKKPAPASPRQLGQGRKQGHGMTGARYSSSAANCDAGATSNTRAYHFNGARALSSGDSNRRRAALPKNSPVVIKAAAAGVELRCSLKAAGNLSVKQPGFAKRSRSLDDPACQVSENKERNDREMNPIVFVTTHFPACPPMIHEISAAPANLSLLRTSVAVIVTVHHIICMPSLAGCKGCQLKS